MMIEAVPHGKPRQSGGGLLAAALVDGPAHRDLKYSTSAVRPDSVLRLMHQLFRSVEISQRRTRLKTQSNEADLAAILSRAELTRWIE